MPVAIDRERPAPAAYAGQRVLFTHCPGAPEGHDRDSRVNVARRLAAAMEWRYGGDIGRGRGDARGGTLFVVPHDALLLHDAHALGIEGPDQIFGGVVPYAFVATKAITHPLVGRDATAPDGWSHACAERSGSSTLRGYTAFSLNDARRATRLLLRDGPVRIKCVSGIGGAGQYLARNEGEADAALDALPATELERGVAVEEHLEGAVTFSAGVARCGQASIAYCGAQSLTRNHRGSEVYGGSTLDAVRGGFDALLALEITKAQRAAVELACAYDDAAFTAYPAAFASRRNYDVLFGRNAKGEVRAGVLEQSWRIGGASGAEVLALEAFRRDPARVRMRCATVEVYDDATPVPPGAFVYYRGVDPGAGALTKYAIDLDAGDA